MKTSEMAKVLTHTLFDSCCKAFIKEPKKTLKRRKQWLPARVVREIQTRRNNARFMRTLQNEQNRGAPNAAIIKHVKYQMKQSRDKIRSLLIDSKLKRISRVRNPILNKGKKLENFWRFMRQHTKASQSITASYDKDGGVVFDQDQVAEEVVSKWSEVFKGQRDPVFKEAMTPPLPKLEPLNPIFKNLPKSRS